MSSVINDTILTHFQSKLERIQHLLLSIGDSQQLGLTKFPVAGPFLTSRGSVSFLTSTEVLIYCSLSATKHSPSREMRFLVWGPHLSKGQTPGIAQYSYNHVPESHSGISPKPPNPHSQTLNPVKFSRYLGLLSVLSLSTAYLCCFFFPPSRSNFPR